MKILHTGDWHIGHVLYGYDRAADHNAMIEALCEVVANEKPDALIISGDVFHNGQPSAAAIQMLSSFMLKLRNACSSMRIIATAGNHDSPSRHEMFAAPWQELGVVMIGQVGCSANDEITTDILDRLIIPIDEKGYVIAMPYVHPRNLPENFYNSLLERVSQLNTSSLPVVMMAHMAVCGSDFTGHSINIEHVIGGVDEIPLSEFGSGYDYLALGHIHHAQFVPGSEKHARYAGSPLPISFDEAYQHSVSIVTIEAHGSAPEVKAVPIRAGRNLITIGKDKALNWDEIRANLDFALQGDDIEKGAFVRVNMFLDYGEHMPPEAETFVRNTITDAGHNFCLINVVRPDIERAVSDHDITVDELHNTPPLTIAQRYAQDINMAFTDEMCSMFNEIVAQINRNDAQQQ
jgi:exonuclease SbcD